MDNKKEKNQGISIYSTQEYKTGQSKTPRYYQDPIMNFAKNIIDYANEQV